MARRDVVVVGASAGGIEPLRALVAGLPRDFPAAVLVVLHVPPTGTSALPTILDRVGVLPVRHAAHGKRVEAGRVYIAPPDQHLSVDEGRLLLSRGPQENGHRPAVDVLFRSAAAAYGSGVVAVVLSGALDDGTAGAAAVRARGGMLVVQDPAEAVHPSMPGSVLENVGAHHAVPAASLASLLTRLCSVPLDQASAPSSRPLLTVESAGAGREAGAEDGTAGGPGRPAGFTCPDCDGSLFWVEEGELHRFRCRVGHAWSASSLLAEQGVHLERALWIAMWTLTDKAAMCRQLAENARGRDKPLSALRFEEGAREADSGARLIRDLLDEMAPGSAEPVLQPPAASRA